MARLIDDPRVKAASLTGSEPAGAQVASQAGRRIKKTVLELGGSDPFVVMPSADLARAAQVAVEARTINNGQSCIAAKRFIVDQRVAAEFEQRLRRRHERSAGGRPDGRSHAGRPAGDSRHSRGSRPARCSESVAMGARLLAGGNKLRGPGNFYVPTVLADVPADSPAYREEMFGPVAVLFRADGLDEAIRLANDTEFGLGASAWTNDPAEQQRCIDEIEAGMVFVNGMVASDARLPFGGVKHSGYGRELSRLRHPRVRQCKNGPRILTHSDTRIASPSGREAPRWMCRRPVSWRPL